MHTYTRRGHRNLWFCLWFLQAEMTQQYKKYIGKLYRSNGHALISELFPLAHFAATLEHPQPAALQGLVVT